MIPMKMVRSVLFLVLSLVFSFSEVGAQGQFPVDHELQGRVEFWKLVFTKYGKEDVVFHHRKYPEIIYSVLDFREYAEKYSGRRYEKEKRKVLKEEEKGIQSALKHLATGKEPRNSFERRILTLFKKNSLYNPKIMRDAASAKMVRSQTGIKERFRDGLVRSGRYLTAIEHVFEEAGLPKGLGRLPLVESSFDYKAYSSVGAAGIWQFMRSTGRQYLTISAAIDDRRDPIAATRAAARYLGNAYSKLGSWPLAITSYNHGLSGVMRAVKKVGSRRLGTIVRKYESKTFGFASSNFYAEFVAALEVDQNAQAYFPQLVREPELRFDEVELGKSVRFKDALAISNTNKEDFSWLNRGLRSPITSGRVRIPKGYILKVPGGMGQQFASQIGASSRVLTLQSGTKEYLSSKPRRLRFEYSGSTYRVRSGDNLDTIARRYRVRRRDLMAANNIRNANKISIGQRLVIPGRGEVSKKKKEVRTSIKGSVLKAGHYNVKRGDTVEEIAQKFGVSQQALMAANGISNPKKLFVGKKLSIPSAGASSRSGSQAGPPRAGSIYTVENGDSLSVIAKRHGLNLGELKKLNPGLKNAIYPGQKIKVSP